jgi:hypothetical protein
MTARNEPRARSPGARLLRLYPASWRARYEAEVLALLEDASLGRQGRLDLVRGAVDAWLQASMWLAAPAALVCGGLWTIAGVIVIGQATPPDWPGYLVDILPLTVAAVLFGLIALVGCWTRQRDAVGRVGVVALTVALIGKSVWALSLGATMIGPTPGDAIVVGQALGLLGTLLVALTILGTVDLPAGAAIALASALMLFGWPVAWLGFGLAWTVAGSLLRARDPTEPSGPGFA